MILSKATEGFLLEKVAADRSARTTEQYRYVLDRFKTFVGDVDVKGLRVENVQLPSSTCVTAETRSRSSVFLVTVRWRW